MSRELNLCGIETYQTAKSKILEFFFVPFWIFEMDAETLYMAFSGKPIDKIIGENFLEECHRRGKVTQLASTKYC